VQIISTEQLPYWNYAKSLYMARKGHEQETAIFKSTTSNARNQQITAHATSYLILSRSLTYQCLRNWLLSQTLP
jgi:hypothetical protein